MYKVVLVEDEPIFVEFMRQAVDWQKFDCDIVACINNGEDAFYNIVENPPDIIFMDINIPKRNGLALCKMLRELNINARIIIMTAHDEFEFAYKAIKLGIDDYLLKPFDESELAITLGRVVEQLKWKTPAQPEAAPPAAPPPQGLADAIEHYLAQHYADADLSVEKLAKALRFENSYLRRTYKKKTGQTISKRLEEIRLRKAKEMLLQGQWTVSEIAEKTGFSNQYYFSTRFKQVCGCTPSEYKHDNR